jgi:carbonic anhydrase
MKQRHFFTASMVLMIVFGAGACSRAKHESTEAGTVRTPATVLAELVTGNERFIGGTKRRSDLATGQHPSAVILACADSRVAPEILFEQGLGELFVVRVAGNVANAENIASIEYAIEHFGSSLVMVMGHESCGAITAAITATADDHGVTKDIAALLNTIRANITSGGGAVTATPDDPRHRSQVIANVRGVIADILAESSLIAGAVRDGTVTLVPAIYALDTGRVSVLGE